MTISRVIEEAEEPAAVALEMLPVIEVIKELRQVYQTLPEAADFEKDDSSPEFRKWQEKVDAYRERAVVVRSMISEFITKTGSAVKLQDYQSDTEIEEIQRSLDLFQQSLELELRSVRYGNDPVASRFPMLSSRGAKPNRLPVGWSEAAWPQKLTVEAVKQFLEWILLCYETSDAGRKPEWRERVANSGRYRKKIYTLRELLRLLASETGQQIPSQPPPEDADFEFALDWISEAISMLTKIAPDGGLGVGVSAEEEVELQADNLNSIESSGIQLKGESKALALLVQHPDWTNKKIAEEVGCSRTTVYKWKNFMSARKAIAGSIPRGSKNGKTGGIEAVDPDSL